MRVDSSNHWDTFKSLQFLISLSVFSPILKVSVHHIPNSYGPRPPFPQFKKSPPSASLILKVPVRCFPNPESLRFLRPLFGILGEGMPEPGQNELWRAAVELQVAPLRQWEPYPQAGPAG